MFRSARWRSEKNKIKVVFKLQFHATQVGDLNAGTLVVSVVPGDVGKPTARLEKGVVQEGRCCWEYPIYETVKFVRDAKTGKIIEKIYHFVVSNGRSKNGLVGEVSIDFANYAWATKAFTISLPLNNPKFNGFLHVCIQRLQADVDLRDVEEAEDLGIKLQNGTLSTLLRNGNIGDECAKGHADKEGLNNSAQRAEPNGNHIVSSGSDITMSSSESSSSLDTPRALGSKKHDNNNPLDPAGFISSHIQSLVPHKSAANALEKIYEQQQQLQWAWSADSDHGLSTDDSTNGSHSTLTKEKPEHNSDVEIDRLKAELVALLRQVDVSELELQSLRRQIVKERKKGQDLSREVMGLKEEKDALKEECEQLKAFEKHNEYAKSKNKLQLEKEGPMAFLEEIKQELCCEKDLNSNLQLQLQKTQQSNAELILAVNDLDKMLELKSKEISKLSRKLKSYENSISRTETDDDEEQRALEELVKEHRNAKETHLLEQKITDLCSEIEICRRDKDELEMHMEQLALDYEILKQENHEISNKLEQSQLEEQLKVQYECSPCPRIKDLQAQIEGSENELKMQSKDYLDALTSINELESKIKLLEEECEKQAKGFEADLEAVICEKVEQEQKAIQAEEALRKTRWKNANIAEKLQEEFKNLYMQMASTFDANEKVAMKALAEASELRAQKSQLEEMLQRGNVELQSARDDYEAKMHELSNQLNSEMGEMEKMLVEIGDKSRQLECQNKHKEEHVGALSQEILRLKSELERLTMDKNLLAEKAEQKENMRIELEKLKTSMEQNEEMVQRGNLKRNELVSTIALAKKDVEKSQEELNRMKFLKDEKEKTFCLLQAEVEALKVQCNDLRHSIFESEQEKETLRKQVFHFEVELKREKEAFTNLEKKLGESNKRTTSSDGTETTGRNNESAPVSHGSKEVANLKEKIKSLKGRIESKETALETSARSFLEKERDLHKIIEELESRVEELNQSSANFYNNRHQMLAESEDGIASNGFVAEDLNSTGLISKENGNGIPSANGKDTVASDEGLKTPNDNTRVCDNDTLSELSSLKERNQSMESELKEMQKRYSEMSLGFAEVEGERQTLVMTLRNLKNAKKG